jgi:3-deoxy-D-manno-octulosonic-acid transferase
MSYFNFTDIANQLLENDALQLCCSSEEIAEKLTHLFEQPEKAKLMGSKAHMVVNKNKGAIQRTLQQLAYID